MYAMDYPYQYVADAVKQKLMQTNAQRVFKL